MGKRRTRYRIPDDELEDFLASKPPAERARPVLGDTTGRWPDPVDGPWEVEFLFTEDDDELVLTGLNIRLGEGRPLETLTKTTLRELPWAELYRKAVERRRQYDIVLAAFSAQDEATQARLRQRFINRYEHSGGRGRPRLSQRFLRDIGQVMNAAERAGRNPKVVLIETYGVKDSTARRYMSLARRLDGPAKQRQASSEDGSSTERF